MPARIHVDKDTLRTFCLRHDIRKLSFFGSVLRDDFGQGSDVDVLVEFETDRTPGFFKLMEIRRELAQLLGVDEVDLRTPDDLSAYFRDEVVASAEVQYARA